MAIYKIIRVYEIPAGSQVEATDRMMEAIALRVESDYRVTDYVKASDDAAGKGNKVDLSLSTGRMTLVLDQLLGRKAKR